MVIDSGKFLVIPGLGYDAPRIVILTAYTHWGQEDVMCELEEWCEKNLTKGKESIKGSMMEFTTEEELLHFILRWS